MNCKICGNALIEGTLFCTNCGAKIEQVNQAPVVNPTPAVNTPPVVNPIAAKKSGSLDQSVLIIGGVVLVGRIISGVIQVVFPLIFGGIFSDDEMSVATQIISAVSVAISIGALFVASTYCCKESLQQKISFVGVGCIGITAGGLVSSILYAIVNLFGLYYYYYDILSPAISLISLVASALVAAGIWFIFKRGNDFKKK